jgi:mono/diheme cytochrome c family protein
MTESKTRSSVLMIPAVGLALAMATAGCASSNESAPATPATPATTAAAPTSAGAPTTFADQVAAGQTAYGANCAACHGDAGQGGKGPRLVGLAQGALPLDPPADRKFRKTRFVTVGDVADFAVANMPPGKGGSLPADQYWAILAFDLHANGIDLPQPLTAEAAKTLTIPR